MHKDYRYWLASYVLSDKYNYSIILCVNERLPSFLLQVPVMVQTSL